MYALINHFIHFIILVCARDNFMYLIFIQNQKRSAFAVCALFLIFPANAMLSQPNTISFFKPVRILVLSKNVEIFSAFLVQKIANEIDNKMKNYKVCMQRRVYF